MGARGYGVGNGRGKGTSRPPAFSPTQAQGLLPSRSPSFQLHPSMASPHPRATAVFLTHPSTSGCWGSPGHPPSPSSFPEVVLPHPVLPQPRASLHDTSCLSTCSDVPLARGHFLYLVPSVSSLPSLSWLSPSSPGRGVCSFHWVSISPALRQVRYSRESKNASSGARGLRHRIWFHHALAL